MDPGQRAQLTRGRGSTKPGARPGRPLLLAGLFLFGLLLLVWQFTRGVQPLWERGHLLTGEVAWEPAPQRPCTPEIIAGLDQRLEIPPPPGGWPGVPQAVNVFNVLSGEVMISQGERTVCGRMHDAASRDSRFIAGVGMVLVPYAGSTEPIRVAWSSPVKREWVPTIRIGAPSQIQQNDTLRLVIRVATLAVAIAMGFTALLGFVGSRDPLFLGFTLLCLLMVMWQAVMSGLTGYPQPWVPVDDNESRWLLAASGVGMGALLFAMWTLAGGPWVWARAARPARLLCVVFCAGALVLGVLLPEPALAPLARVIDVASSIGIALVFVVAVYVAVVRGRRGARARRQGEAVVGPLAMLPFMVMGLLEVSGSQWLAEYRMEGLQFCITWFLTVGAYVLNQRLGRLRRQRDEMQVLADTDALTGVSNRRAGLRTLESLVAQARVADDSGALAVAFLDIDLFKQINDEHGHEVGDRVLVEVARVLLGSLRNRSEVVRMGGEEFLLMLPGVELASAAQRMEAIRVEVAQVASRIGVPGLKVTASIGLTALGVDDRDAAGLLRRADGAMYRAKRSGRDQVVVDPPPLAVPVRA